MEFTDLSSTKTSFGIITMLNMPTDYLFDGGSAATFPKVEVFSQLNVTPVIRSLTERQAASVQCLHHGAKCQWH